jgi:hypothetical protein
MPQRKEKEEKGRKKRVFLMILCRKWLMSFRKQ